MIVIVDYGLGNLFSVKKAFEYLGAPVTISSDPSEVAQAERLVLPGVGAFGDGMNYLRARGLDEVLRREVIEHKKPFLGICLGLQLLGEVGFEFGENPGLGWIKGFVRQIDTAAFKLKLPHIGWNTITALKESLLFKGVKPQAEFYFLHSFQLVCADALDVVATTEYGETITAAIERGNIFATQFHPEKSQDSGFKILENFMAWNPT